MRGGRTFFWYWWRVTWVLYCVGAVRSAYRELVQVWHPDRFGGNAKLEARAQEKLKRINLAYERLRGVMEAEKSSESSP